MAQAATQVEDAANDILAIQGRLNDQKAMMLSGWQGNASAAFNRVFVEFDNAFRKTQKELNGIHEKLVDNRIRYEANEDANQADIDRLNGLLNF